MTESIFKRLWKKRKSGSKPFSLFKQGFSLISLCSSSHLVTDAEPVTDTELKRESVTAYIPEHKLWRKPLPTDCPLFDFSSSETLVGDINDKERHHHIEITVMIPTRNASKFYRLIPHFEEHLERTCNNKKVVLLSKALVRQ